MRALQYEYLICAAFQCEKGKKHGASAEIYYGLLNSYNRKEIDLINYGIRMGMISAYLSEALIEVKEKYDGDSEIKEKLEECQILLHVLTYESISECVDKAADAFVSVGLLVK